MTLFAEIASAADGGEAPVLSPQRVAAPARSAAALRDRVAADVERICACRRGTLLLAPDYGVDDVTLLFHSFPMIDAWAAHLEATLARYEPRLRNVHVVPVVTESLDMTLRAEIQAVLATGEGAQSVRFTASLDPQSRLSVR